MKTYICEISGMESFEVRARTHADALSLACDIGALKLGQTKFEESEGPFCHERKGDQ